MNPVIQPGHHPDADVLNAFTEHALPEAERAGVVEHMADCARCREVVFLARAAAEPETALIAAAQPGPRPSRLAVAFAKWRVALIPAAAFAAVGAIVVWVQMYPTPQPRQMAKLRPPPVSQTAPAQITAARSTNPAPAKAVTEARAPLSPVVAAQKQPERTGPPQPKNAVPADAGLVAFDQLATENPDSAPPLAAGQGGALGAIQLDGRSAATAQLAPRPQPIAAPPASKFSATHGGPQWQRTMPPGAISQPSTTLTATAPAASAPPPAVPAPADIVTDVSIGGGPQAILRPLENTKLAPQPLSGATILRLSSAKLPSGLDMVSSAALLNRLLAVDSAGAVFLSQDGGQHWHPVPARWTGKAVKVQAGPQSFSRFMIAGNAQTPPATAASAGLAPGTASGERANPPAPTAPPANASSPAAALAKTGANGKFPAPALAAEFKLVTDRHEVWVSTDGRVWRAQTAN